MTAQEKIDAAMRVSNFLKDPAIITALAGVKWRNYERFESADSSEKRVQAWACAHVLKEFEQELQLVIDQGEHEVLKIADAVKRASRAPQQE